MSPQPSDATIVIAPLSDDADADAFRALNEEWITATFALVDQDRRVLDDPRGAILDVGGVVLLARDGEHRVGCVALLPTSAGERFELAKMAVAPAMRGRGVGRMLILAAIDEARRLGATVIELGSSTRLPAAVHLYESVGFEHAVGASKYARADVFMELHLER